jgi:predicted dehydrogenase
LQKVKQELEAGTIGQPVTVRAHWGEYLPGWHPWEDYHVGYSARKDLGGGVILTLSHPLDYLRWLLGEVASVWSFSGKLSELNIDVEDCAEIGLAFMNGVIGSIHLNYIQQPPAHQVVIVGSAGTLTWDYYTSQTRSYQTQLGEWISYPSAGGFERNDLFLSEMRHFLQIIRGEAVPICSLDDGIHALDLSLAAYLSQEQGKLIQVQS